MAKYDYRGVIHCHSTYSFDGKGDMEEIGKAANDAGLDFVMMTDHDTMEPVQKGERVGAAAEGNPVTVHDKGPRESIGQAGRTEGPGG